MFLPATISLILFTLFLNFNIFTKEIILFSQSFNHKSIGRVMGVMENNQFPNQPADQAAIGRDLPGARKELDGAISKIVENAKEIAISNSTNTITFDDFNSPQIISPPRQHRPSTQPLVNCGSALVLDLNTGKYIYTKENEKVLPIASITKLMSALVFVDTRIDWNKKYEIQKNDKIEGGRIILFPGEVMRVRDLFNLSLVGSDNMAIMALVHSTGLSEDEFVKRMNERAAEFGMTKTTFTDPTGLNDQNVSNVHDLAVLARESFSNPEILLAVSRKDYTFTTDQGRKKYIKNTDNLIGSNMGGDISIVGGKTGYNEAAGYCFVGKFIKNNQPIISVVLKAGTKNSRFSETEKIVKWAYENL